MQLIKILPVSTQQAKYNCSIWNVFWVILVISLTIKIREGLVYEIISVIRVDLHRNSGGLFNIRELLTNANEIRRMFPQVNQLKAMNETIIEITL